MLEGFVPYPPEFAARYRAAGYWEDRLLRDQFGDVFARHGDRVAVIDGEVAVTYRQLNERAERLALNLLDLGLKPMDRVVVQLPNVMEFVTLYFALQKIPSPSAARRARRRRPGGLAGQWRRPVAVALSPSAAILRPASTTESAKGNRRWPDSMGKSQ